MVTLPPFAAGVAAGGRVGVERGGDVGCAEAIKRCRDTPTGGNHTARVQPSLFHTSCDPMPALWRYNQRVVDGLRFPTRRGGLTALKGLNITAQGNALGTENGYESKP